MPQEELLELIEDTDGPVMIVEDEEELNPDDMGISKSDQEEFGFVEKSRNQDVDSAVEWIDIFFAGKQMYYGGNISSAVLHSPAYVDRVLNLDIVHGIKKAYELIEITGAIEITCDEDNVPEDVSIVVNLLEECHRLGVPKYYAAGIVLMALELCYGVVAPLLAAARSGF